MQVVDSRGVDLDIGDTIIGVKSRKIGKITEIKRSAGYDGKAVTKVRVRYTKPSNHMGYNIDPVNLTKCDEFGIPVG